MHILTPFKTFTLPCISLQWKIKELLDQNPPLNIVAAFYVCQNVTEGASLSS